MVWFNAVRDRLRTSLWFIPGLFALTAVVLALVLVAVDREPVDDPTALSFVFGGTAEGARSVLSTIAQSMLTFTALVFTITMLVLQLASNQLSPRVMRTFLRDRGNQFVLGLFVATFVYTLLVLREVRTPTDAAPGFVPGLSIWAAFVLLLASVAAFIYYIDHMAHAIRASTVITSIWAETAAAIDRLYPERIGVEPETNDVAAVTDRRADLVLKSPRAGVIVSVDDQKLLAAAAHGNRRLELLPLVGEFISEGAPLARLWGTWDRAAAGEVRGSIGIGDERTLDQDAAFGLRQLVDVALRALSPGTNDPTTAVQALDRIHDLLRRLVGRRFPSSLRSADDGTLRLVLPRPDWDDYVSLGLDEIRLAAGGQLQVNRRLRAMLDDLAAIAPDNRLPVIRGQLARLEGAAERGFSDPADRDAAGTPGMRGGAAASRRRARCDR